MDTEIQERVVGLDGRQSRVLIAMAQMEINALESYDYLRGARPMPPGLNITLGHCRDEHQLVLRALKNIMPTAAGGRLFQSSGQWLPILRGSTLATNLNEVILSRLIDAESRHHSRQSQRSSHLNVMFQSVVHNDMLPYWVAIEKRLRVANDTLKKGSAVTVLRRP